MGLQARTPVLLEPQHTVDLRIAARILRANGNTPSDRYQLAPISVQASTL